MSRSFQLLLVRHGETEANIKRIVQGQMDVPLNEKGRKQADELGQYLKDERIDVILTSDLKRAHDTASSIAKYQTSGPKFISTASLRERAYGIVEGKNIEFLANLLQEMNINHSDRTFKAPGNSESMIEVQERVVRFISQELVQHVQPNLRLMVVSHGGVIREFMCFMRDSLKCSFSKIHSSSPSLNPVRITPNTGLTRLEITYKVSSDNSNTIALSKADCIELHSIAHLRRDSSSQTSESKSQVDDKESVNCVN